MVISPIIIILCSAIIIFTIIFYIINRPSKPVFTGVLLFLLLCFALLTMAVNMQLSSYSSGTALTNKSVTNSIVAFITLTDNPSQQLLTEAFELFCKIDIGFIVAVVVSMLIEIRNLFHFNKK